jgi:hypothetical protein
MLVAFLSLLNGTTPGTCLIKAVAAFLVFAGFGLILRYALLDAQANAEQDDSASDHTPGLQGTGNLDMIVPGTSVADLLASQSGETNNDNNRAAA